MRHQIKLKLQLTKEEFTMIYQPTNEAEEALKEKVFTERKLEIRK